MGVYSREILLRLPYAFNSSVHIYFCPRSDITYLAKWIKSLSHCWYLLGNRERQNLSSCFSSVSHWHKQEKRFYSLSKGTCFLFHCPFIFIRISTRNMNVLEKLSHFLEIICCVTFPTTKNTSLIIPWQLWSKNNNLWNEQ